MRLNLNKLPGFCELHLALAFFSLSKKKVTIFIKNIYGIEESREMQEMQYEHIKYVLILYLSLCVWI